MTPQWKPHSSAVPSSIELILVWFCLTGRCDRCYTMWLMSRPSVDPVPDAMGRQFLGKHQIRTVHLSPFNLPAVKGNYTLVSHWVLEWFLTQQWIIKIIFHFNQSMTVLFFWNNFAVFFLLQTHIYSLLILLGMCNELPAALLCMSFFY